MRLPDSRTPAGAAGLAAIIAEPARSVLAFDFDGTLSPIVDRPEDARPAPGAVEALARLARVVGSVVIVTGRPAATAVEIGEFAGHADLGRLVVLGHYGFERWHADTGEVVHPPLPAGVQQARDELPSLLAALGTPEGTAVEDKGAALGVHVRRTPDPEAALALLREPLLELAARSGLVLEPGRMVLELRPPGMDKGAALTSFAAERAARAVLFGGDDLGDLPAYDAVERLRTEGVSGVTVCSGSTEVTVLSARADIVVDGPVGMVALLAALAAAIGSGA